MNYHWSKRFECGWKIYIIIKIPFRTVQVFLISVLRYTQGLRIPPLPLGWYITTCTKYFIALQNWYIQFSPDAFACEYDIHPFFSISHLSSFLILPSGNPQDTRKYKILMRPPDPWNIQSKLRRKHVLAIELCIVMQKKRHTIFISIFFFYVSNIFI